MLATSMLQVGVDVQRLGLMLVVGQPKNTAEYIQASSRVGRDADRPGLVVALGNWARPRDLAHFEQFRHYHETFYAQVEALSVTPYSPTSLDRGIDGLLVSAARVAAGASADGLSPERSAWRIKDQRAAVEAIVERLKTRIAAAAQDEDAGQARQRPARQSDRPLGRARQARRGDEQDAGLRTHRRGRQVSAADHEPGERQAPSSAAPPRRRSWSPTRCAKCSPRSTFWSAPSPSGSSLMSPRARRMGAAGGRGGLMTDTVRRGDAARPQRSARPARPTPRRGRPRTGPRWVGAPVVAALHLRAGRDHGPARVLGDARRSGRLGADLETARTHSGDRRAPPAQVVRMHLGPQVDALRPFPWQPKQAASSKEGADLGIPARVFPQWFRCTGCDYLGPLPRFTYTNTHPFRPDLAQFTHKSCPGRGGPPGDERGSAKAPRFPPSTC